MGFDQFKTLVTCQLSVYTGRRAALLGGNSSFRKACNFKLVCPCPDCPFVMHSKQRKKRCSPGTVFQEIIGSVPHTCSIENHWESTLCSTKFLEFMLREQAMPGSDRLQKNEIVMLTNRLSRTLGVDWCSSSTRHQQVNKVAREWKQRKSSSMSSNGGGGEQPPCWRTPSPICVVTQTPTPFGVDITNPRPVEQRAVGGGFESESETETYELLADMTDDYGENDSMNGPTHLLDAPSNDQAPTEQTVSQAGANKAKNNAASCKRPRVVAVAHDEQPQLRNKLKRPKAEYERLLDSYTPLIHELTPRTKRPSCPPLNSIWPKQKKKPRARKVGGKAKEPSIPKPDVPSQALADNGKPATTDLAPRKRRFSAAVTVVEKEQSKGETSGQAKTKSRHDQHSVDGLSPLKTRTVSAGGENEREGLVDSVKPQQDSLLPRRTRSQSAESETEKAAAACELIEHSIVTTTEYPSRKAKRTGCSKASQEDHITRKTTRASAGAAKEPIDSVAAVDHSKRQAPLVEYSKSHQGALPPQRTRTSLAGSCVESGQSSKGKANDCSDCKTSSNHVTFQNNEPQSPMVDLPLESNKPSQDRSQYPSGRKVRLEHIKLLDSLNPALGNLPSRRSHTSNKHETDASGESISGSQQDKRPICSQTPQQGEKVVPRKRKVVPGIQPDAQATKKPRGLQSQRDPWISPEEGALAFSVYVQMNHPMMLTHEPLFKEYTQLVSRGTVDFVDFGLPFVKAKEAIDVKLGQLSQEMKNDAMQKDVEQELRQGKRHLKGFTRLAEAERLLKLREGEEDNLCRIVSDYHNRSKKAKSTDEDFLERPVRFESKNRSSFREKQCKHGLACALCTHVRDVQPRKEPLPLYRRIDIMNMDPRNVDNDAGCTKDARVRNRPARPTRSGKAASTMIALNELKRSIAFIEEYNSANSSSVL